VSFDTDDGGFLSAFRSVIVPSGDVLLGTAATALTLVVGLTTAGVARAALGLLLVFFLQGYAVVAAAFPTCPPDRWVVRRLALPFGVSLAMLPPLGLALSLAGVPFTAPYVLGISGAITVVGLLAAGRRRVHRQQRSLSAPRRWVGGLGGALDRPAADLLVNALTLVAVVTAMSGLVFAVVAPAPQPQYASFSVLTENESGELVASGYPTEFTAGQGQNVVVEIANRGADAQGYTVVVQLQRFDQSTESVSSRSRLLRLNPTVAAGETWTRPVTVTPDTTGQRMRLAFLLYADGPPENPTVADADEHLFLWVNVTGGAGAPTPTDTSGATPTAQPGASPDTPEATATPADTPGVPLTPSGGPAGPTPTPDDTVPGVLTPQGSGGTNETNQTTPSS